MGGSLLSGGEGAGDEDRARVVWENGLVVVIVRRTAVVVVVRIVGCKIEGDSRAMSADARYRHRRQIMAGCLWYLILFAKRCVQLG